MRQSSPGLKASPMLSRVSFMLYLLLATIQLTAQNPDPLKLTINVEADQQPLEKLLNEISSTTKVKFAYDVNEIKKYAVTLREKKQFTIEDVLKMALKKTDLAYESHANTIVIFNKDAPGASSGNNANTSDVRYASYTISKETITGTVMDDAAPLQNVNISIKGTAIGTQTDEKGFFKLEADDKTVTVIVSYVGYQTREVPVVAGVANTIRLEHTEMQLEKVVVVGYGTQKRANISGAVAEVKLDKLSSRSIANVAEALQGKAPGVIVTNEGGDPTASPHVYIRGLGGINGEQPLYVIDGSVYSGTPVINPNEIESINVLKDASAAIYGARASGGVILITTKKGRAGTASITLDAKYGVQSAWRKLQALDAKEYAYVINTAADNAGKPRPNAFNAAIYPDGQVTKTNWVDDVFQTAPVYDYNVGINGGNDKAKYYMSFGYRKAKGVLLNTYTERYNFRLNSDQQLKSWLKFGENLQFTSTNGNGAVTNSAYTGALLAAIFYPPSIAPYNADGTFAGLPIQYAGSYGDVINPVAYLKRLDRKSPNNNLFVNPWLEAKLMKDLTFRSNLAVTKAFSGTKEFDTRVPEIGKIFNFNKLIQTSNNFTDLLVEQTLNYTKKIGDHDLSVLAGYTYQHAEADSFSVYAQNFNDESVLYRYFQNANDIFKPSGYKSETSLVSYLARINYNYQEKYLLSLLGRRDGTSLVASKNKFANYGSVSGAWLISKEHFLHNVSWLSSLKLRSSYGILGNLGSLPVNAVNIPLAPTSAYLGQNPALAYGYAETGISNPNLKWASSQQTNVGLDAGFINNRLSLVADYFIKNTRNMLLQIPPASTSGVVNGQWDNVGKVQDKGIELGINYNSAPGKAFQYSAGATLTKISNKLIALGDGITNISTAGINIRSTLTPLLIREGSPLYSYNVIQTAGIFKTQAEIDAYKNKAGTAIQPNAKPGDLKFIDASGDGKISDSDRVVKGSAYPSFTYGFSFNASYKNFDLNLFVQGVQNNKIFNGMRWLTLQAGANGQNYNMQKGILDAWSPTNPNGSVPRVSLSDPNGNFGNTSDWFIENGSYMRLKNITLGYTLPAAITHRVGLNTLRLYVTANNLLTITKYSGFDPEIGMNNYGIDLGGYPQARSVLVGLNVNF